MKNSIDLMQTPTLYSDQKGVILISGGECIRAMSMEVKKLTAQSAVLVCHRKWTEVKIGCTIENSFDILELFAFCRPSHFCLPTPAGIATRLGLPLPITGEEQAKMIARIALNLLDEIKAKPISQRAELIAIIQMMGSGGWLWAAPLLACLGASEAEDAMPDVKAAAIWLKLPEIQNYGNRPPPDIISISHDQARKRLKELLGNQAEARQSQSDYAAATADIFDRPSNATMPRLLLSEAGTGTGKTLGYLAPATLWAEQNKGAVWISTYTRALQNQIAEELSRIYLDRKEAEKKIVIRKGRENYLCLRNFEQALKHIETPIHRADAIGLGLLARWAANSPDGDLTGSNFPAWLTDLFGTRLTTSLSDKRGECIHSACSHYNKCFIEKTIRLSRKADIVIANHALVIIQARLMDNDDINRPTRYIFDEGHHVFDAADNAFATNFTAADSAELRLWICGAEGGRQVNRQNLKDRLSSFIAFNNDAIDALNFAMKAAQILPGAGWQKRIFSDSPAGPAEAFFYTVKQATYDLANGKKTTYNLEAKLYPPHETLIKAIDEFHLGLVALDAPLTGLIRHLENLLDKKADTLSSQMRGQIDWAIRGINRWASGPLKLWVEFLEDIKQGGQDKYVDWMQIDRGLKGDINVGLKRHWLDPSLPFAEHVLSSAYGVAITSATLIDHPHQGDIADNAKDQWQSAKITSGATHLAHPPLLSQHSSPFDYANQARIFLVNDVDNNRAKGVAAAMGGLITNVDGGALGLFTSIARMRDIYPDLLLQLQTADISLYAQHIDKMNLPTLLQLFREDRRSTLIGTDAIRDGVDVPGDALQLMIYDRVPWSRPDILFNARAEWQGSSTWRDRAACMRLRQAFGRLIRRSNDKGVFVMLDKRMPTRYFSAFPSEIKIQRMGIAEAIAQSRDFLSKT